MADLRKLEFVKQQLAQYSGPKKVLNDTSTFVCCPYHAEVTPSFRIFHSPATKSPGWGKCYGCGKSVSWAESAPKLGLKAYVYAKPTDQFATSSVLRKQEDEAEELTFSPLPKDKIWRTIPTNFLTAMGCKLATNQWNTKTLFMPITIFDEERGYIKARLRKAKDKPSYINAVGKWSEHYGLFPYDYVRAQNPKVVVLVEGPRDSARFNYNGIPTLGILGTQSWSKTKSRLVALIGADAVILVMDGDCAGIAAENRIAPLLSPMVDVHTFSLYGPDSPYELVRHEDEPSKIAKKKGIALWDPGNCPTSKIQELKRLIKKLSR